MEAAAAAATFGGRLGAATNLIASLRSQRVLFVLVYGFVLLAMPGAVLGVAWPDAAEEFGRSLGDLGIALVAHGVGYAVATLAAGRVLRRFAAGPVLAASAAVSAAALAAIALAEPWWAFLASLFAVGVVGGLVDAATNAYGALKRGPRAMSFLHAGYGVGTILGPLLATALIALGASWRIAFGALAAGHLVSVVAVLAVRSAVDARVAGTVTLEGAPLRSRVFLLSIAVFLFYDATAAGMGAWAYTVLTEGRQVGATAAGLAVAAYWAGFTASRLLHAAVGHRFDVDRTLAAAAALTMLGLLVFWWNPVQAAGLAALPAIGFAHGPVFPLEMHQTPRRFGSDQAPAVVGFQITAAIVGVGLSAVVIGYLVGVAGVGAVAPALVVFGTLTWLAIVTLSRWSPQTAQ